jgi:hypothetical protein
LNYRGFATGAPAGRPLSDVKLRIIPARRRCIHGRCAPPRVPAARLAIDELAEAVVEAAFTVLDTGGGERVADAERAEFTHGMRQQRDADAQGLDVRRALDGRDKPGHDDWGGKNGRNRAISVNM